jgi:hypothetical protein
MGTVHAAACVGAFSGYSLAPPAEDAGPSRGEPCEIRPDHLIGIGGVHELDPLSGEIQRHLRHA